MGGRDRDGNLVSPCLAKASPKGRLVKFAARSGLIRADAARGDFCLVVVLSFDRSAREAAQHGELSDVVEGIGNRSLEEFFGRLAERLGRGEVVVELLESPMKAGDFGIPSERLGIMPNLLAARDGKTPVEEVADVRQDLRGCASGIASAKSSEGRRGTAQSFTATVSDRR